MSKKRSEHRREERRQQAQRDLALKMKDDLLAMVKLPTINQVSNHLESNYVVDVNALRVACESGCDLDPVEQPTPPTPTFSECVVGYRRWVVDAIGQLRALTMTKQVWVPGENVARCRPADSVYGSRLEPEQHDAPHDGCKCGLYAWSDPPLTNISRTAIDEYGVLRVLGGIAVWGDLCVHEHGFRASHACPVALSYDDETPQRVQDRLYRTASDYGIAIVHVEELQDEVERHGTPLPYDVRPNGQSSLSDYNYLRPSRQLWATWNVGDALNNTSPLSSYWPPPLRNLS